MGRRLVLAAAVLLTFMWSAASAGAHAVLERSQPGDGASLAGAPHSVRLRFSEPISGRFQLVRLLDGRGRVVAGTSLRPDADPRELILDVPRLRRGTYEVTWQVLAEDDGHVTGGALVFGVGVPAGPAPRPAADSGPSTLEAGLRWLDFALYAFAVGGLAVSVLVLRRMSASRARAPSPPVVVKRALAGASLSAALAAALGVVLLVRQALALPTESMLGDAVGRLLGTRWGVLWLVREVALAGLVVIVLALRRGRVRANPSAATAAYAVAGCMVAALAVVRALGGHGAAVAAPGAHVAADAVHVLAAALWMGGVAAFAVALRPSAELSRREALAVARACRRPLAWVAGISVAAVAATGLYAAGAQVASVDALLTTGYGQELVAKSALVLVAGALGAANFLLLRRGSRRVARLMLVEGAVGLGILLAAAEMTATAPPRGPEFDAPRALPAPVLGTRAGDVVVSATARPNRPGANIISVLAVSARRPAPAPIDGVTAVLSAPGRDGAPRAVPLTALGGGRWAGGARLGAPGRWTMSVVVRRGSERLSAGLRWTVAPPDSARPVVISARRLAPLLDRAAAFIVLALAAGALALAASRLRRPVRATATVALLLVIGLAHPLPARADASIDAAASQALAAASATQMVDVLVVLRQQARLPIGPSASRSARRRAVLRALRDHADAHQRPLLALLARAKAAGRVGSVRPFWIFNGLEVVAEPGVIAELAALPAVGEIRANATVAAPPAPAGTTGPPEPNIALVNAPALWDLGDTGQGVVVATLDTGVDATHPALAASWRGGSNSWYDPSGQHPTTPIDVSGHGTWTTGVMVGSAAGGTSVGIAPGARWIAAKIFDDRGVATTARIHAAFQWLLDPDGNPLTDDAPDVVNDSWNMSGTGCLLDFELDLQNLRAADILPVFSAGNRGPTAGSSVSPANNPEAFSVGGVDLGDVVDPSSSRGPSACGQAAYPSLTAPGVDVYTADLYGSYTIQTGTSLAAAHASGALALLLHALPSLTADQQDAALRSGAVDLGSPGADDAYGSGRLDVLAAYTWAATAPDFGVTATPGSASTPAGGSVSYDIAVSAVNGFGSDVALSVAGLPAGKATASFAPPTVAGGSGTATLTVSTSAALAPGTYRLTIRGTSGATTHGAPVLLVVSAPPDFTLSAAPASASTLPGGGVAYTVTAASKGGFSGDIGLAASGLPAGATATFSPATITGGAGSAQLSVSTTSATAPGTYPVTITGTSGSLAHAATVTLVVTATPDFSLAIAPASATVTAGLSTTYTVTVSAQGGFAGNVSLSVAGLPSAATGSFSVNPVVRAGTSTLTVRTQRFTTRGTFTIRITGKSGTLTHQITATLVVRA